MARTTRRGFLACGVAALSLMAFAIHAQDGPAPSHDAVPCPPGFGAVSRALTGHDDLDMALAPRIWAALLAKDSGFAEGYDRLAAAIRTHAVTHWQDYAASGLKAQKPLHDVAVEIVAAWYLGRVGPMRPRAETGIPAFITYEGAMMWRPTRDVTVLPTYARGGPGFWAQAPSSLETD